MLTYDNGLVKIHRIDKDNKKYKNCITPQDIYRDNSHDQDLIELPQNDTGNAERFLLFCRKYVVYNTSLQEWMLWNGKLWSIENSYDEIMQLAQAIMERYYWAADSANVDKSERKKLLSHAKRSNNKNSLVDMLTLVMHMNYVKEMKSKPYLLNTQSCVVDLRTKEKLPHHPKYGCSNICICDYNPDAKSTRFKSFAKEIMSDNEEVYDYMQTATGCWTTGERREEKLWILLGNGSNGKSKYLEAIAYTLGGYACLFPTNALTKGNGDAARPTPELVPLVNSRFAHTSELEEGNVINDGCIKQYTGNAQLLVRKMRKEYSKVDVSFKIVVDSNYPPNFKRFDYAIKRRIVIIPFTRQFKGKDRDNNLVPKLQADCEYILKYLVDGAYNYYKYGLQEPEIIREETEKYCIEADSVRSFLDNATVYEKGCLTMSSNLHRAYVEYCEACAYDALDNKSFSQTLIQKGYEKKIKNKGAFFKNIKLI